MMMPTTMLSEKLENMASEFARQIEGMPSMTLTADQVSDLCLFLSRRATDARSLEKMLERRLKASDVPAAPLPPVRKAPTEAPPTPANLVQFRPRPGAKLIPIGAAPTNGGAA